MKKLIKKYGYYIPNKYKNIDTSKFKYRRFTLFEQEWKLHTPDILNSFGEIDNEIYSSSDEDYLNRESRSSLAIEGVYKESTNNYKEYMDNLDLAKRELFKNEYLSKELINKIYLIASGNEELIDEDNIKLEGKSLFRNDDIYIGDKKAPFKGKELEKYVEEFCSFVNKMIDEDISWFPIYIHFFFEYLHPLPDYNGRIGRLLLSWGLDKISLGDSLSNYILNNKNDYYKSISLTEKYNDLTFSLIYFIEAIIVNIGFINLFIEEEGEMHFKYKRLNEPEQQALFNLFTKRNEFGWKDYKEYFKDHRTKQQIHNILSSLEKKGFIKSNTYANNLKRYYYPN